MRKYFIIIALGLAATVSAVEVNMPEVWPGTSLQGWLCMDRSVALPETNHLSVADGMLWMTPQAGGGASSSWSFVADSSASDGHFAGSYYDAGVHTLSFRLASSCSANMTVELVNDIDFIIYNTTIEVAAGAIDISLPVNTNTFHPDFFAAGSFEDLLRGVEQIWIDFEWDGTEPPPTFAIDDVLLSGAGAGYGEWIDGFSGMTFPQRLAGADADGDGILNADEFYMDSRPDVVSGPFIVSAVTGGVKWNSSANCRYTVLCSTNLVLQTFEPVAVRDGSGGEQEFQGLKNLSPAFYKIQVERK